MFLTGRVKENAKKEEIYKPVLALRLWAKLRDSRDGSVSRDDNRNVRGPSPVDNQRTTAEFVA